MFRASSGKQECALPHMVSALVVMPVVVWSWGTTSADTIYGSAHSCFPDDGHNDARNMLR